MTANEARILRVLAFRGIPFLIGGLVWFVRQETAPKITELPSDQRQAIETYCHYRNIGSKRIETMVTDYKTRVWLGEVYCDKLPKPTTPPKD